MSGRLIGWTFDLDELSPNQKLVLLALADNADREGICWPSQAEIARKTGFSRQTVCGHMKALEEKGFIAREPRMKIEGRGRRSDLYRLGTNVGVFNDQCRGEGTTNVGVFNDQCRGDEGRSNKGTSKEPPKNPVVGRKRVTEKELHLAAAVVSLFNSAAGTAFSVDPHLVPIVMRIREKPEYTERNHELIVKAVFAGDHWWSDPATPKIIYGNAAQFEQSIELAKAAQKKREKPSDLEQMNEAKRQIRREQGLE